MSDPKDDDPLAVTAAAAGTRSSPRSRRWSPGGPTTSATACSSSGSRSGPATSPPRVRRWRGCASCRAATARRSTGTTRRSRRPARSSASRRCRPPSASSASSACARRPRNKARGWSPPERCAARCGSSSRSTIWIEPSPPPGRPRASSPPQATATASCRPSPSRSASSSAGATSRASAAPAPRPLPSPASSTAPAASRSSSGPSARLTAGGDVAGGMAVYEELRAWSHERGKPEEEAGTFVEIARLQLSTLDLDGADRSLAAARQLNAKDGKLGFVEGTRDLARGDLRAARASFDRASRAAGSPTATSACSSSAAAPLLELLDRLAAAFRRSRWTTSATPSAAFARMRFAARPASVIATSPPWSTTVQRRMLSDRSRALQGRSWRWSERIWPTSAGARFSSVSR